MAFNKYGKKKYSDDNAEYVSGKISDIELDVRKTSKQGKKYKVHTFNVDDKDFSVLSTSPVGKFLENFNEGDKVKVKLDDDGKAVAVFKDNKFSKGKGSYKKEESGAGYSSLGAIQGNTMTNAIALVCNGLVHGDEKTPVSQLIVEAAKQVIIARVKVDELVEQAQLSKDEDDSHDEPTEESDGDEESEEDIPY